MKKYVTQAAAIIDLHERGFINDFQLFGNDLLWIQEKIFVRPNEFSILECYRVDDCSEKEVIIFGVLEHSRQAKGILLHYVTNYSDAIPPVIVKKLKEAGLSIPNNIVIYHKPKNNYSDEQEGSKIFTQ